MDVMIDVETLGTAPGSAVVQIGAVLFEPRSGGKILNGTGFNQYIRPDTFTKITAGTIVWWLRQSDAARRRLADGIENAAREDVVLKALVDWPLLDNGIDWRDIGGVWAHGTHFDIALLEAGFDRNDMRAPWHYRAPRDDRTLFAIVGGRPEIDTAGFVEHDALDDAVMQAMAVQKAMGMLGR